VRNSWITMAVPVIVAILLTSATARAQSAPTEPAARPAQFDATGYVAWFRGNRGGVGGDTFRDWYTTALWSAGAGHYWTEHLKTEAEFGVTGRGNLVSFEDLHDEPSVSRSIYRNHSYRLHTLSLVQTYQFRRNVWIHPFAGAGLDLDWERRTVDGSVQVIDSRGETATFYSEPLPPETHRRFFARAMAVAGFKAYLSRNAFLRTDLRASVTDGLDQVAWRFGFGWDF
jgi:Outer membrane protein beta-barrel domain